jgi:AraC family L-rhamnose operon regulatory protein RhaS
MVNNAQKNCIIYDADNRHYRIDDCLLQRQAIESGKVGFHAISSGHYPGTQIEPRSLDRVSSLGCLNFSQPQKWGIPKHRNEGIEIAYQETGNSTLIVNGQEHQISTNSLSITRPWQPHSVGNPFLGPGRMHWLIIDVGVRRPHQAWSWPNWSVLSKSDQIELISKLRGNEQPVWSANLELKRVWQQLSKCTAVDKPESQISRIRIYLNELLVGLLDLLRAEKVDADESLISSRRTVEVFIDELKSDDYLLAKSWTLDSMAESCGMKRTTFSSYCRDITNLTPIDLLNTIRLDRSRELLLARRRQPITQIAFDLGFSSSQYFARRFTEKFSCSPRELRRQIKSEINQ